jgi:hypothetical protein
LCFHTLDEFIHHMNSFIPTLPTIQSGTEDLARQPDEDTDEEDDVHIKLSGKYELEVTPEMIDKMETDETIDVVWFTGKAKKSKQP